MRKLNVRLLCEFLLWLLLAFLAGVIGVKTCHAQIDNLIYAKQFPGLTVGQKVTAAMATCNPGTGTTVPCIIVLDPSLAAYATGTLPTLCGHCYLWDWRDGPPGGAGSGITQLTGPVTAGPGSGSQHSAITAVNSDVGSCGDSTHVSQITLNAAGQATACIPVSISGGGGGSPTVLVTGGTVNCLTTACAGGSTYANNTTYTNRSTSAVFEEVSITATSGSPCTGADFSIVGSVNGATAAQNGITNACQGFAGIGFWVLPGQTLSALATHIDGGGAVSITQWYEFTPATTVTGGGGGVGTAQSSALFQQVSSSPVLTKGGTYNGWSADAIAAPSICWDGARYVMSVSLWSIANSKWASAFFTSTNMKTWTYVTGSLLAPTGSDYILGNGGIAYFDGAYWLSYSHYPSGGTSLVNIASSSNLTSWTTQVSSLLTNYSDTQLDVNPGTGLLELWSAGVSSPRNVYLQTSSNGTTWTAQSDLYTLPPNNTYTNAGEPSVFYVGTTRFLTFDNNQGAPQTNGRYTSIVYSPGQNTTWYWMGSANFPVSTNAWEASQVFDATVIVTDTGDGNGSIPRMLYAGGDNLSSGDNTDSSIGYATASNFTNLFGTFACYSLVWQAGNSVSSTDPALCWNPITQSLNSGIGSSTASIFNVSLSGTNIGSVSSGSALDTSLGLNGYFDGTHWERYNTSNYTAVIDNAHSSVATGTAFYTAAPASNPISNFAFNGIIGDVGSWFPKQIVIDPSSTNAAPPTFADLLTLYPRSSAGGISIVQGTPSSGDVPWLHLKLGTFNSYFSMAAGAGTFFSNAAADDTIYRGDSGTRILLGIDNGSGTASAPVIINSTGIVLGAGTNVVYRCTTAGTLPVGALTTVTGNCGASVATALTVN